MVENTGIQTLTTPFKSQPMYGPASTSNLFKFGAQRNPMASMPYNISQIDPKVMGSFMTDYMSLMKPYMGSGGETDPQKLAAQRMAMLDPYLTKPRSKEAILAEQEAFFGDDVAQDAKTQAFLSLAKYGSQVAQTPGSLLQALVTPAGDLATDLSKVAGAKSAAERQAKEFAYSTAAAEKETLRQQQLSVFSDAINSAAANSTSAASAKQALAQAAINQGLTLAKEERNILNDAINAQFNANTQFATTTSEVYGKLDEATGTYDVITVRRTSKGPQKYDNGEFSAIPKGYVPLDATSIKALAASNKIDFSSAKPQNLLIPDAASPTGFKQVAGFENNGSYYVSATGNVADAKLAPSGFIRGEEADVLQVSPPDRVGRVYATIKAGPNAGTTFLASMAGKNTGGAYLVKEPEYENGILVSGNPLARNIGGTGVPFANLSVSDIDQRQKKVTNLVSAYAAGEDVLRDLGEAVGPLASVKSFTSNNIAMFLPDSWSNVTEYAGTEAGRRKMQLFARELARGLALSDRYAVAEQNLITQLSEDPAGFFKNPNMAAVRFQELMRVLQNELSFNRAVLGESDFIRVERVPTGTDNDPFIYNAYGHYDYLSEAARKGAKLGGTKLQITREQLKRSGMPEDSINSLLPQGIDVGILTLTDDFSLRR